jgi:hypothetical protein
LVREANTLHRWRARILRHAAGPHASAPDLAGRGLVWAPVESENPWGAVAEGCGAEGPLAIAFSDTFNVPEVGLEPGELGRVGRDDLPVRAIEGLQFDPRNVFSAMKRFKYAIDHLPRLTCESK